MLFPCCLVQMCVISYLPCDRTLTNCSSLLFSIISTNTSSDNQWVVRMTCWDHCSTSKSSISQLQVINKKVYTYWLYKSFSIHYAFSPPFSCKFIFCYAPQNWQCKVICLNNNWYHSIKFYLLNKIFEDKHTVKCPYIPLFPVSCTAECYLWEMLIFSVNF